MENKQRNKALFCGIILVLAFIVTTSSTVAFFTVSKSDNETIVGEAAKEDLSLSVSAVTDVAKGLIPIREADITKGLKGEGSACIDANGNTVCQIYKFTVTNNSDVNVAVNGEVKLTPEEGLTNLRWALLTSDKLQIDGESKDTSNISLVSDDIINVGASNSKDYYIVVYLNDTGEEQDAEQGKGFSGTVTFYAAQGDMRGTTATFGRQRKRTSEEMLTYLKLTSNGEKTSVTAIATTDEGIFEAPDDYGTSYYFRGAVTNNYVKFAGYYWRVIRINGDGTIRMIYDGTSIHRNGEVSTDRMLKDTSYFNTIHDDNAYVGYMYGSTGQSGDDAYANTHANTNDSTIKMALDTWYDGLAKENKNYIADSVFCGDRQIASNSSLFSGGYTSYGYGRNATVYVEGSRSYATGWNANATQEIKLSCANKTDRYTVNDRDLGNGALIRPVGLITASEVRAAGGLTGVGNSTYYLYTGQGYWTMSPAYFYGHGVIAYMFRVGPGGDLYRDDGNVALSVRPVLNLKSDITFSEGDGSYDTPWIVETGEA